MNTLCDEAIEGVSEIYFPMEGIIDDFDREFDWACCRIILDAKNLGHEGGRVELVFEIEPVGLIKHEGSRKFGVNNYIHSNNQALYTYLLCYYPL